LNLEPFGALPNTPKKRLRWRISSGTPTLEHFGRGSCKNQLPGSSRDSSLHFASPAPDGVGMAVAKARGEVAPHRQRS
jgi:hypothetical protein